VQPFEKSKMSDSISEKVKNLLRLARCKGATPAEAASALNKALELIDRHQIDVASLNLDEQTEALVEERVEVGWRVSLVKKLVGEILVNYFPVRCCLHRNHLVVIGFEQDVSIAGYVFSFLVGACNRSVSDYVKREKKARRKVSLEKKQNFIRGWMYGVAHNLRRADHTSPTLEDSKTALVVADRKRRIESRFDELFPTAKDLKIEEGRKNSTALTSGWLAGKSTSIHQPLSNTQQGTLLLQ